VLKIKNEKIKITKENNKYLKMLKEINKKYRYIRDIEKGAWGQVKLYYNVFKKQTCVCKYIEDEYIYKQEVRMLNMIKHPSIIEMYEDIKIDTYNIIVMEYINAKDLFYILSDDKKYIKLQEKEMMIEQIISGIEYLHKKGIAHMDIKIENILYNTLSKKIKIIDFGISLIYKDKTKSYLYGVDKNNINWYYPPECYLQRTLYIRPEKIDIWCLGLLIYNIIYQVNVWDESNYQCKYYVNYIKTGIFMRKLKRQRKAIENDIDEFIREILEINPRKRKSIYYVKLSFNVYKIKKMMQFF